MPQHLYGYIIVKNLRGKYFVCSEHLCLGLVSNFFPGEKRAQQESTKDEMQLCYSKNNLNERLTGLEKIS